MANVDCMTNVDLGDKDIVMQMDDGPPTKKMKQGRLPFKPLDHSGHARQSNTPPGSKKRKLSGNESPSAKQLKTGLSSSNLNNPVLSGEHEVSSSSETETLADLQNKSIKKLNTIDKFFRPKQSVKDQEEISSTNEDIEIDLTNEESDKENPKTDNKVEVVSPDSVAVETKVCDDVENKANDEDKANDESDDEDKDDSMCEDKENVSDIDGDSSFIDNTSVCEDALKTPIKSTLESVLKTPVTSSSGGDVSQGSASENTPVSGQKTKKRSAMSESKRKEREIQRQKAKEEKDRQKEEQRLQKEREKEEKKQELLAKKKQKEEQKEKERLERERLKQEEKEKKEKERLDKLKQKEELKKQKEKELECKNEEKRKKEEERKQKEEERRQREEERRKEEEEKQRKADKKKEMFKGFFIQKEPTVSPPKVKEMKNGLFMPFELKANMKLAPSRRSPLTEENKQTVDDCLQKQDCKNLYLNTMKSSTLGKSFKTWPRSTEDDDDIEIMSHEKHTIQTVTYRAKFLHFHENTRPAYYGTWRKKSHKLSPRNPFKQDEELFDYEIDSDDEWEEEEPGESVSSDEDDDDNDKCDDDDGAADVDDWMVPHGYLSDDEGVKDEEEIDAASKQDLQRVRQAAWESELKRQAKPLKMLAIGCNWENDDTTTIAVQQLQTLLKYKAVCLLDSPISTSYTVTRSCDTESNDVNEKTEEKGTKKKCVPEEAMKDLIRLVHGNPVGIKKLMKEFLAYWRKKNNPDLDVTNDITLDSSKLDSSKLDMSMDVDEKVDPSTDLSKVSSMNTTLPEKTDNKTINYGISKRQLEIKILAIAVYEKRSNNNTQKGKCWYIKDETLEQYDMKDLPLPNSWEYVCIKPPPQPVDKSATPRLEDSSKTNTAKTASDTPKIMKFAQPMSPSKIQALGAITSSPIVTVNKESSNTEEVSTTDQIESTAPINTAKVIVPPDQRKIKDMFSSFNKNQPEMKSETNSTSSNPIASNDIIKPVLPETKKLTNTNVTPVNQVNEKIESSSPLNKPVVKKELIPPSTGSKETTPKTSSGMNTLKALMSSPELMKSNETKKLNKEVIEEVTNKEQPMDVDIIVLD